MKYSDYKKLSKDEKAKVKFKDLPARNKFGCFTFLAAILFVAILFILPSNGNPSPDEAYTVAKEFVKRDLLDPESAEFLDSKKEVYPEGQNVFIVLGVVKATNKLGTKPPREFRIKIRYNGNGLNTNKDNWSKIELDFE